jgi:putative addiction module CopG family antidote
MTLTVEMPEGLEHEIDSEVEKGRYQNKSELVRDAIRRLLEKRELVEHRKLSKEARQSIKEAREQEGSYSLEEIRDELGLE